MKKAICHFTDEVVDVITYLGNEHYKVVYPAGDTQAAHESTLEFISDKKTEKN